MKSFRFRFYVSCFPDGYGATLFKTLRCESSGIEFPLTLGRDFVGTVVHKGFDIKNSDFRVGDSIWGVVPVHHQGCHCEYVAIDKCYVSKKPENVSDLDASAVLYAGMTAWSGLFISAQLGGLLGALCSNGDARGKKVLVLGAAGGVGSLAVQMLLAEGVEVVATASSDGVALIQNLGVTKVVDYTAEESDAILVGESPYDIILDCAGKGSDYAGTLPWTFGSYVTFKSPLLKNFDSDGLIGGGIKSARDLITSNLSTAPGAIRWGYFMPAQSGIQYLKTLVEHRRLLPIIDSTFTYDELPAAYRRVQEGHLRGKVVIDFSKNKL